MTPPMSPSRHSSAVVAALIVLLVMTMTASRALSQAATRSAPIVTIARADGTSVRGKVVAADRDQVTVQSAAPGEKPQSVPWDQIKRISNGLTREQAHAQWKEDNRHRLCDACAGERVADCATCHGTGQDPEQRTECNTRHGGGRIACTNDKCDRGKVDCPKPCLKLSQGQWITKSDGKKYRTFRGRGGSSLDVSEGQFGELVDMNDGVPKLAGKCPECNGMAKITCPTCKGEQTVACVRCAGVGTVGPPCPACGAGKGKVKCETCGGSGLRTKPRASTAAPTTSARARGPGGDEGAGSRGELLVRLTGFLAPRCPTSSLSEAKDLADT
jgi:hypothetical protein